MKRLVTLVCALTLASLFSCQSGPTATASSPEPTPSPSPLDKEYQAISLAPFSDAISHARYGFKDHIPPYQTYTDTQVAGIAENFLTLQNPDGGWAKNHDWAERMSDKKRMLVAAQSGTKGGKSTLDNRNVFTQIEYLAKAYKQIPDNRYVQSIERALTWILQSQDANSGGFTGADVHAVTYNDDVMAGALRIMREVSSNDALYNILPAELRQKAKDSYDRGIQCILNTQIKVNGRLTAWCQQHDHQTLEPIWARSFEPASITASESVGVVILLMEIENPSKEIQNAIIAACQWFDSVKFTGKKLIRKPAEPATLSGRYSDYENVLVDDPDAPALWARFYDLKTEVPLWYDRDRKQVEDYNLISRERRVGYGYVGTWPSKLLTTLYPEWRAKNGL